MLRPSCGSGEVRVCRATGANGRESRVFWCGHPGAQARTPGIACSRAEPTRRAPIGRSPRRRRNARPPPCEVRRGAVATAPQGHPCGGRPVLGLTVPAGGGGSVRGDAALGRGTRHGRQPGQRRLHERQTGPNGPGRRVSHLGHPRAMGTRRDHVRHPTLGGTRQRRASRPPGPEPDERLGTRGHVPRRDDTRRGAGIPACCPDSFHCPVRSRHGERPDG